MFARKTTLLLILLLSVSALFAQQKYALVIGNANYANISRLTNPVNDANDMETALRNLGFAVEKVLNGSRVDMENAITRFKNRLSTSRNSYGFFFYAGHGVQSGGVNYLIPVDANIPSENYLPDRSVSVQTMMNELSDAGNELNMIVLDACRDNPFGWSRSGSRGLTVVSRAPSGSIVMYATSADSVAEDGTGRNGLFTGQLLNNLRTQGLSVYEVFDRTMGDVIRVTNGRQHPELSLRFAGASSVYLGTRPSPTPAPQPAPTPTPQPAPTPTPTPQPVSNNMVRINSGTFMMGSPASDPDHFNDEIQHRVTVSAFYMGKYEVTQKEYQEMMGTNPSRFKGDNLPIENVTWFEAVEYCNRRSQREGLTPAYMISGTSVTWNRSANGYRLPTEAEWECACRAGTTTAFNTGASINNNAGWYDANSSNRTHPVGEKSANAWGLYDMHGNVWEWCWDWYEAAYSSGAQTDPVGPSSGSNRVVRGGGWDSPATLARSAYRSSVPPSSRIDMGFRVVHNAQ
jgi:formylglycine-generating enzyme required for sulfatase activity